MSSESSGKKREEVSKRDYVERGVYQSSPLGTGIFVGLRAFDPFLQYGILRHNYGTPLLHRLGASVLPPGPPLITGISLLDKLSLSPYRSILLAMSIGSALKQNYWVVGIQNEAMPPSGAITVSLFNTLANSINSFLFICSATSASANGEHFPQTPLLVGSALYVAGLTTELVSEIQRRNFKRKTENKGKVCDRGLWSWSRHINYGGYMLWRSGYALAAGGWVWGAFTAALATYDFVGRAIPVLDQYCEKRYGEQWKSFRERVPYQFLPLIY
ncbi:MAG: hypothetical protein M1820_003215 [Bogoriella megaspora]|nr:MAG: hypothetical protein M1820_003215 [Bogoriella megaspora]